MSIRKGLKEVAEKTDRERINEGRITEEGLQKVRQLEGTVLRPPLGSPFNELACKETIRHFADGVGDDNPLWRDGSFGGAYSIPLRNYMKHPAWGYRDLEVKCWNSMASVHWDPITAKAAGLPYAYVLGRAEQSWVIHSLTNWMGDEGWLKRCYAEYRLFIFFSDVVWLGGRVTEKHVDEDGDYCVKMETNAMNQRGENCIPGQSVIALPSREAGAWPVERRLRH